MAKFRNQLSQSLILDGEWQVALSSISFPSNIQNVNSNGLVVYKNSGVELDASNNRSGHLRKIRKGIYSSLDHKTLNRHQSDFPVDITCGSQLIFVYIDIIEYQIIGEVRAPVIKIIETERRLRNGSINTVTPIHHKTFTILDYKPILSNNIQNIKVELGNEAGKLIPFNGTGKVIVGLKFQKIK